MSRLPGHVRQRVRSLVESLAGNPTPQRSKRLRGFTSHYRVPVLAWRVIYRVDFESSIVTVLTVRSKQGPETYENIEQA